MRIMKAGIATTDNPAAGGRAIRGGRIEKDGVSSARSEQENRGNVRRDMTDVRRVDTIDLAKIDILGQTASPVPVRLAPRTDPGRKTDRFRRSR